MNPRQSFIARADGWVAGRRVRAGEALLLTEVEARFEPVDPAPVDPAPADPAPAKAPRRRRVRA